MDGYSSEEARYTREGGLLRSFACSVQGHTTEETLSVIERLAMEHKVLSLYYLKDDSIDIRYLDDGGTPQILSYTELLEVVPIEVYDFGVPFVQWVAACSDIMKAQNVYPKALLAQTRSMVYEALGMESLHLTGDSVFNYDLIGDSALDGESIFLLGVRTSRSDPLDAVACYRFGTDERKKDAKTTKGKNRKRRRART